MRLERSLELPKCLLTSLANNLVYYGCGSTHLLFDIPTQFRLRLRYVRRRHPVPLLPHGLVNGLTFGRRPLFWSFVSKNPVKHGVAEVPDLGFRLLTKAL